MSERERVNQRLRHLQQNSSSFPSFNVRALLGTDSILDVLKLGEFSVLSQIDDRLTGGGSLSMQYDAVRQAQSRELYVALQGTGAASGRLEFEVEREHGVLKQELTIKIRDAASGAYAVRIDGVAIGTLTVGSTGFGRLELSTAPGTGELPFAGGVVPDVHLGSLVEVGDILSATIGSGFPSTDGTVSTNSAEWKLTGSTSALAFVEFEVEPEDGGVKTELKVDVRNAPVGSTQDFFVNGVDFGDIAIDDRGRGLLRFSTQPAGTEVAFPAGFPELTVGTSLAVGTLVSGIVSSLPSTVPGGTVPAELEFQGGLFGATAARGGARFETELEDGGFLEREFRVHVRNAAPGSQHDIRVAGVLIGQVAIGADGRGVVDFSNRLDDPRELALPANFPDIQAGTRVEVGSILSGFLSQSTTTLSAAALNAASPASLLSWPAPTGGGDLAGGLGLAAL